MAKDWYYYTDKDGNLTNFIPEIVTQEVILLCYTYIEANEGQRPSKTRIKQWVSELLEAAFKNYEGD